MIEELHLNSLTNKISLVPLYRLPAFAVAQNGWEMDLPKLWVTQRYWQISKPNSIFSDYFGQKKLFSTFLIAFFNTIAELLEPLGIKRKTIKATSQEFPYLFDYESELTSEYGKITGRGTATCEETAIKKSLGEALERVTL